jgi:hypothetical protein
MRPALVQECEDTSRAHHFVARVTRLDGPEQLHLVQENVQHRLLDEHHLHRLYITT